jgi:hypothetical protein
MRWAAGTGKILGGFVSGGAVLGGTAIVNGTMWGGAVKCDSDGRAGNVLRNRY